MLLACFAAAGLAACGGSDDIIAAEEGQDVGGETAAEAGPETSGETGGEAGDETGSETGSEVGDEAGAETGGDAMPGDDGVDAGCGALSAGATEVFVDKSSTKPSVGTAACPFKTIKEATDLEAVSGRTVRVKGGGGALVTYEETGALKVKGGVTLRGDGTAATKIVASGTCAEGNCAVEVASGGTLDGFTITGSGHGVVTLDGGTDATVKNVLVTGAQDGILVLGPAALAGNVQANKNTKSGLHVKGSKAAKVTGSGNQFNENETNGIEVEGSARLDFAGGTASTNKGHGVHLRSTTAASTTGRHSITGLTASSNGRNAAGTVIATSDGIVLESTGSLTLRTSKLLTNTHHGLVAFIGGNTLDLASGGNTFGVGSPTATRNVHAGVCLENTGASGSIPASGNSWSVCPLLGGPAQTGISGSCTAYTSQVDIAYKKAAGGGNDPLDFGTLASCTVGTP
ncbi:MAG: right-handed parallel beta-helix repeat-containing protein [Deltaproteobacteria bacterium]|nr:right-handed parallel beta-helix repeat-containing protein [Deltaproteobacteria bacterium]